MDTKISKEQIRKETTVRILKISIPVVVAAVLLSLLLTILGERTVPEKNLRFTTADRGDIDMSVNARGTVVPAFEEVINSPISSRVIEVRHRIGDIVEPGTPLMVLDLHAARTEAEKQADMLRMRNLELGQQIANDKTFLNKLEMQLKVGAMKIRRLEAELRNERYLDSIGSGTTDKVREAEFALRSAELEQEQLEVELANERTVRKAASDVKSLEIEILAKEANMASRTLDQAEIRSPRHATITSIVDKIGSNISQGQEVAVIADLDHYKIEAEAAETYAGALKPGATATIRLGSFTVGGKVASVSPTSKNGTVAFTVFPDNDSTDRLRPGLRPDVYVSSGIRDNTVRIANGQYYKNPGLYTLFVRKGDELVRRTVRLGEASMNHVEVIEGLAEGEEVVISDMSEYESNKIIKIKK